MERLNRYTPEDANDDTVRVLEAFLNHLPPDGRQNLVEHLQSPNLATDENVRKHAKALVQALLIPMKAQRNTPDVVISPRPGMEESIEDVLSEMTDPAIREAKLKRDCLNRDGHMCAISKMPDSRYGTPRTADRRNIETECAHIIPFSLGTWKDEHEEIAKANIWANIRRCFPGLLSRINFNQSSINDHRNCITMWIDVHKIFGGFTFALEETAILNTYNVKSYNPTWTWMLPSQVRFVAHDDRYELPSPELLKIHAIIARILHASGKGEQIDKILRDRGDIAALAKDGSTDLAALLAATTLGALESRPRDAENRSPTRGDGKARAHTPAGRAGKHREENVKH